jgi:serine/threonine protein kinase
MAPETHGFVPAGQIYAIDIWTLGEISFQLMTKTPTFRNIAIIGRYTQGSESFLSDALLDRRVTRSAVDFVSSAMSPLLEQRLTAHSALSHSWMVGVQRSRASSYEAQEASRKPYTGRSSGTRLPRKSFRSSIISPKPVPQTTGMSSSESQENGDIGFTSQSPPASNEDSIRNSVASQRQFYSLKQHPSDMGLVSAPQTNVSNHRQQRLSQVQHLSDEGISTPTPETLDTGNSTTLSSHSSIPILHSARFSPRAYAQPGLMKRIENLHVADIIANQILSPTFIEEHFIECMAISPDGKQIALTGNFDRAIKVWDAKSGQHLNRIDLSHGTTSIAFHPTQPIIAVNLGIFETFRNLRNFSES